MTIHLIRLCVGVGDIEHLRRIQANRSATPEGFREPYATTRRTPTRAAELLDGGSLYWVMKGHVMVRQRILGVETVSDYEGKPTCLLTLHHVLVPTLPVTQRPFQGWRYLPVQAAPPDLATLGEGAAELPPDLAAELNELGLL
ncbi:MAG: DUF1489 family protein [Elsteraceae bacterium]